MILITAPIFLYAVHTTPDGDYVMTGYADYHVCVIKADEDGNLIWKRTYGTGIGLGILSEDNGLVISAKMSKNVLFRTDIYGNLRCVKLPE